MLQKQMKKFKIISQIDCSENNLTKGKEYEVLDIHDDDESDYFVFTDDTDAENCLSVGFFDVWFEGEKIDTDNNSLEE